MLHDFFQRTNLQESIVKRTVQLFLFCSAAFCDSGILNTVGSEYLHIFWEQAMTHVSDHKV